MVFARGWERGHLATLYIALMPHKANWELLLHRDSGKPAATEDVWGGQSGFECHKFLPSFRDFYLSPLMPTCHHVPACSLLPKEALRND